MALIQSTSFDAHAVRKDFPILSRMIRGKPLVYLDNAATSHKPRPVLDAMYHFYQTQNANVHRAVHALGEEATFAYESSRKTVSDYINAQTPEEIIFVRGATEAINLVAQSFLRPRLREGDVILLTLMEHHANIVPWQMIAETCGARIAVVPLHDNGDLDLEAYRRLLTPEVKMAAFLHISQVLGTINPVKEMVRIAHEANVPVLVDGAQAIIHGSLDVQDLDADFYAFSGHKALGPTGIGVLYGKMKWLESMPPYQGGGSMIERVRFDRTTYQRPPLRFEAGTPNTAGAVGLAEALRYLNQVQSQGSRIHEKALADYTQQALASLKDVKVFGSPRQRAPIFSFHVEGLHPHDIATILDYNHSIAVRAGHHCAQPLMQHLEINGTARASLLFYNTQAEIDQLVQGIHALRKQMRR